MKALTDRIIDRLNEFLNIVEKNNEFKKGIQQSIIIIKQLEKDAEFEEVARIMMKHLCNGNGKYHPHHKVIIDSTMAELFEGCKCTGKVLEYIN